MCQRTYARWHYRTYGDQPARRTGRMGVIGLGEGLPTRIDGVEQRCLIRMPLLCPKCHGTGGLTGEAREIHCHLCGGTWFLVQ